MKKASKKDDRKKSLSEKDEILNELAIKLRLAENRPSVADLEEDVELNLEDFKFHDFVRDSDESSAPVLERIAGRQAGPVFVGGISRSSQTIPGEEKELDPFKYVPSNNANGEPKYIESDSHITAQTERADFNKLGRNPEFWKDISQEAMFMQSSEAKFESQFQERMRSAERFDERERKKNPNERDETKYDKYKPDLPKSR